MSYYYRGNLAVELEQSRSAQKTIRTVTIKPSIPTGEKLLYLFFISLVVVGVGFVGLRYSQISQYNYEIQSVKKEIRLIQEQNAALQLQIDQMSNRDRIISEAEKMGMVSNPDAVRVIGQAKAADKPESAQTN